VLKVESSRKTSARTLTKISSNNQMALIASTISTQLLLSDVP
jgi:hypothetical protein